ncbi:MAG: DEAD/DEAH box helicase [Spirochaetes bacterium]|nr:MAG: DEAD/DEAH box helicase [Spirochaetota bacterium]
MPLHGAPFPVYAKWRGTLMFTLTEDTIRNIIAHSPIEFARGEGMYRLGQYRIARADRVANEYAYVVGGEFCDYDVMLSLRDAGGLGLNLQGADCVINIEPPWNPAKLNQRIGRLVRIGQKSASVTVIDLIARDSIEERIWVGSRHSRNGIPHPSKKFPYRRPIS